MGKDAIVVWDNFLGALCVFFVHWGDSDDGVQ